MYLFDHKLEKDLSTNKLCPLERNKRLADFFTILFEWDTEDRRKKEFVGKLHESFKKNNDRNGDLS